jgi:hypothetical protein
MRVLKRSYLFALVAGGVALTSACTAKVEDKGELPTVHVEEGRAPQVDVEPAKVEVTTDTQHVVTPEVHVVPDTGR